MIVALAIVGALIAVAGSVIGARATEGAARLGKRMLWTGYAVSGVSVVLFIVTGFWPGW